MAARSRRGHAAAADTGDRPGRPGSDRRPPRAGALRPRAGLPGPAVRAGGRAHQSAPPQDRRPGAGPRGYPAVRRGGGARAHRARHYHARRPGAAERSGLVFPAGGPVVDPGALTAPAAWPAGGPWPVGGTVTRNRAPARRPPGPVTTTWYTQIGRAHV